MDALSLVLVVLFPAGETEAQRLHRSHTGQSWEERGVVLACPWNFPADSCGNPL